MVVQTEKYLELEETRKKNIRGTKRAQMDKSGGTIMYLDTTMGDKEKKEENDKFACFKLLVKFRITFCNRILTLMNY